MTKIPHYKEITLKSGKTAHAFKPSQSLQDKLGVKYEQYDRKEDALARIEAALQALAIYKASGQGVDTPIGSTVGALVRAVQDSSGWDALSDNSKRNYDTLLRSVLNLHLINKRPLHDQLVANIRPRQAEAIYKELRRQKSLTTANQCIKVLRRIWAKAPAFDFNVSNPFAELTLLPTPARTTRWDRTELDLFITTADANGLASIGTIAALAFELGQRPSDCRSMTWSNYRDGFFVFKQQKTGAEMDIPATALLRERINQIKLLSNCQPDAPIATYEGTGERYSGRLYRKKAELVRELAGLDNNLKISDLRRSAATELGDSGCSEDQLKSITGHRSRAVLNTYVQTTRHQAQAAQDKREAMYG